MRLSLLFLLVGSVAFAAERKPNVVLILIDDLGGRDLGCYGSKYHHTPHLDAFAKQATKLTDAYAACPVCSPTRLSILTGKNPARLNLTDWLPGRPDRPDQKLSRPVIRQEMPLEEVTLAEALKTAGYATCHIGKWHLGGKGFEPEKQGFDVNIGGSHIGHPPTYFAPYANKRTRIPGLENAPKGEYLTDRLTTEAEKFITANKDKPFFLYLSHYTVHTPLQAKADQKRKYKEGTPGRQANPTYAAMVESMDDSVGRVLKTLHDLKLDDDTIVIFTSDNGGLATFEGSINGIPATNNSPLREGKGFLYEGGVRIPMIWRGPGIKKVDIPMSTTDIMPTVLGLCGVKTDVKFDGHDLSAALGGANVKVPDEFFWHYPHYANQGSQPSGAVRSGKWKMIELYETGRRELYDLSKDISESRNIAAENPEVVKELAKKLADWRTAVGAKMTTPNPKYLPCPQAKNGNIPMPGKYADVHGSMLRFEPLPHKNTLGYWVKKEDYATWEFTVTTPGTFTVEVVQGCGKGSGGAEVEVSVDDSKCTFKVEDTGGFQMFKTRDVGQLTIAKVGRHTLTVKPLTKPGPAVMDLRKVTLKPVK